LKKDMYFAGFSI